MDDKKETGKLQFIIFTGGEKNDLFDLLFADLKQMNNVRLDSRIPAIPKHLQWLWKVHHAKKLNRKKAAPFRGIWNKYSPLRDFKPQEGEEYCLVFNNVSIPWFEPAQLNALKKKYKLHLAIYFLDSFQSYYSSRARMSLNQVDFDLVYTFHKPDEVPGKIAYFDTYYSRHILESMPEEKTDKPDVFFWGIDSGRGEKIEAVYEVLTGAGLNLEFGICYSDENREKIPGITYNEPLPYPEVIRRTRQAGCIVDIVGQYSGGISLRAYEAVTYGKKLLTDNPLVKDMRFYDPKMMQIFSDPKKIDLKFLEDKGQKENPYGYTDEYSPVHFIERMEEDLK